MSEQSSNMNQQLAVVPVPVPQLEPQYRVKGKNRGKPLKKSTRIRQCSIAFNLVKAPEDEVTYVLKVDKVNDIPMEETAPEESNMEKLPATNLLEQWDLEVRQRDTGRRDKVYSHPRSSRRYRSLVEVSKFIRDNYRSPDQKLQVRHEKKRIPLHKMHNVVAANNAGDGAEILDIPFNEETESDDGQEIFNDNSGNMTEIPVIAWHEEIKSDDIQGSIDNSGNKVAEIPIVPKEEGRKFDIEKVVENSSNKAGFLVVPRTEEMEFDVKQGIFTGSSNYKAEILVVPKEEEMEYDIKQGDNSGNKAKIPAVPLKEDMEI